MLSFYHYHLHCGSVHQDHVDSWQEGGGPAALGLRPMQQPSLRQTQAVLLLGWKGLIAQITSIWSPWITNLHIMFDHVWYFVDLSCTSVYRGVAKIELCDGVCCFSTSPHIWNCMKLPFLGWLESFCPERLFEHELPRCSRIPCMLGNSENALWCIAGISMNFYGSPGGCISLPCISSSIGIGLQKLTLHEVFPGSPKT